MKKTFRMTHPKKAKDRLFEAAINDVKKYFKRETKKELPEDFDMWDFDCKYGVNAEEAKVVSKHEVTTCIHGAKKQNLDSFYIEIIARAANKPVRIRKTEDNQDGQAD